MKRPLTLLTAVAALAGCATTEHSPPTVAAAPLPEITIYHLEGRRSERVVWLMEELGLPYKLEFKRGDLAGSMAASRRSTRACRLRRRCKYGDQVIVESGAIIETILNRHAPGKLQPALDSPDYPYHLIWMHYAEGSLASRLIRRLSRVARAAAETALAAGRLRAGRAVRRRLSRQASVVRRRRVLGRRHHDEVPARLRRPPSTSSTRSSSRTSRRGRRRSKPARPISGCARKRCPVAWSVRCRHCRSTHRRVRATRRRLRNKAAAIAELLRW